MSLAQDLKKFDNRPVINLPSNTTEQDIFVLYYDCFNLIGYISWILSGETPPPKFGTYFASRNEFLDPNAVFTKNIFAYLKKFNPSAPENKEITKNLSEIVDFLNKGQRMEMFNILPRKFNLRVNLEAAIAQAITEPHIKFDNNNPYRKVWNKFLQEHISPSTDIELNR